MPDKSDVFSLRLPATKGTYPSENLASKVNRFHSRADGLAAFYYYSGVDGRADTRTQAF